MIKLVKSSLELESKTSNLMDQMERFSYQLGLKNKYISKLANTIAKKSDEYSPNKKPSTKIATSIYMASLLLNEPVCKTSKTFW